VETYDFEVDDSRAIDSK